VVVSVLALIARWEANNAREQANNAREQTAKAKASDLETKKQLGRLFEELGRQKLVEEDHPQEAIPYFLEARRNGLDTCPTPRSPRAQPRARAPPPSRSACSCARRA
jgi:hypothetical protein